MELYAEGRRLTLGSRLGKGGEGEVYALKDDPSRAVKLYTNRQAGREGKVLAMVRNRLSAHSSLVAFPLEAVRNRRKEFLGFTMRRVDDHRPLFELYSPGARRDAFPNADLELTRSRG